MADLREKIQSRYGIDIDRENIFKLYRIDRPDLTEGQLEEKIKECRERWQKSINGANEKNAERDRARLEKAAMYEGILKDTKLRKELYRYYEKSAASGSETAFARDYFMVIGSSRQIVRQDVDFFFRYFKSERKNRAAILEMLKKEFKVSGLGKEGKDTAENGEDDATGEKKKQSGTVIVNRFQETTILDISKCFHLFVDAASKEKAVARFPKLSDSLYDLLELDEIGSIRDFAVLMKKKREEASGLRLDDGGQDNFTPLVDLFNKMAELAEYKDVSDNFPEFKLLIMYEKLNPYMFLVREVRPRTLETIFELAKKQYAFLDMNQFVAEYFEPIYDNFGIVTIGLGAIFRKAGKKASRSRVMEAIDKFLGIDKRYRIPLPAMILHYMAYLPIYLLYLFFEASKVVFAMFQKIALPVFAAVFFGMNFLTFNEWGISVFDLLKIPFKSQWYEYLSWIFGFEVNNWAIAVPTTFGIIGMYALLYLLTSYAASRFTYLFASTMNANVDWVGFERTFREMFKAASRGSANQFRNKKSRFYAGKAGIVLLYLLCIFLVTGANRAMSTSLADLGMQTETTAAEEETDDSYDGLPYPGFIEADTEAPDKMEPHYLEISASAANIRSGAGTDYAAVSVANAGEQFEWTGETSEFSDGTTWYEIYLDDDRIQTGWVSGNVIIPPES